MESVSHFSTTATSDTCLAAALAAVGVAFESKPFIRVVGGVRGEKVVWFFEPRSRCGKFDTRQLMAAWGDDAWHLANPEHPFAYIKCAMANRTALIDKVKQDSPLACIQRKGKMVLLPLDAPGHVEDLFLRQL